VVLTTSKPNSRRLAEIMSEWQLDAASVARLTSNSPVTVSAWLRPADNKAHRNMPDRTLELLELKLGMHKHKGTRP
jgi:hypothetical protein